MWRVNKLACLACIFSSVLLFGGSVRIFNDSPYELKADILAADGSHQASLTLAPQQPALWQDYSGGNSTWSQTPYTVILTCKNGKQFGTISGIGQGGTVSVMTANGPRFCDKDKKDQHDSGKSSGSEQQSQMPFNPNQEPFNPNQTPYNPNQTPFEQGQQNPNNQQGGSGAQDPLGPADPHSAPGDPIWGPP